MRYSKYNIFKTDGNSTWIFNCLTSSFVMVENKVLNELAHDTELQKGLINEGRITKYTGINICTITRLFKINLSI